MGLLRMLMDALHYALLAVLVLLVSYAASTYGLFKEHAVTHAHPPQQPHTICKTPPNTHHWRDGLHHLSPNTAPD